MEPKNRKEGVSVKEIENFAKKHRLELVLCLAFLFACFFNYVFFRGWSIPLAAIGAILGTLLPAKIELFSKKIFHFIFKQEIVTQLVLGIVALIFSIFIPPIIFLFLGLHGGKAIRHLAMEAHTHGK